MLKTVLSPFADKMYAVLRIVSGGLLALAGSGKIFGLFGQHAIGFSDNKQMFIGGLIELVGGLAITFGLFTRCAAFVCSGMMAVAYWQFHVFGSHSPAGYQKFIPTINQGMPAVLLCFTYLYIACRGAGPWSLDAKREAPKPA
jgi:putative oxidoreductase